MLISNTRWIAQRTGYVVSLRSHTTFICSGFARFSVLTSHLLRPILCGCRKRIMMRVFFAGKEKINISQFPQLKCSLPPLSTYENYREKDKREREKIDTRNLISIYVKKDLKQKNTSREKWLEPNSRSEPHNVRYSVSEWSVWREHSHCLTCCRVK